MSEFTLEEILEGTMADLRRGARTVVRWLPVLDKPVHLFDVADDTRQWEIIKQRSLLFCAFSGLPVDELKMIAHVFNLIDKTWGAKAIADSFAEERMMLTCLLARRIGRLDIQALAGQYRPYQIDVYTLIGGLIEFFIERFSDIQPKSAFRFIEDKSVLLPLFPSPYIELYDLLNAISIGCSLVDNWLKLDQMDWNDESTLHRFESTFGGLSVICASVRYAYNKDMYGIWVENKHSGWDNFFALLSQYPRTDALWNVKLLRMMVDDRRVTP